jgi:hypothetical protein
MCKSGISAILNIVSGVLSYVILKIVSKIPRAQALRYMRGYIYWDTHSELLHGVFTSDDVNLLSHVLTDQRTGHFIQQREDPGS